MRKRLVSAALALLLCLSLLPTAAWAAETAFRDVSGHWAEETITAWQEKGNISGYNDGTFRPNDSVTRAEFVKLLNRALGLTAEGTISFTDVKESDWFYAEVAKAVAAGYASGMGDGMFQPEAPITRAQAAAMLARARSLTADESRADRFSDASAIPAWAKGSVGAVAASGYMTGYPDGSFGANGQITRAEAVVTLDRAQNSAQDVTIETAGTVLKDQTVTGDLLIAASVGEGNVTLQNITVQGNLIIRGGGPNSVYLDGVTVQGEVRLEKDNLHVHLQGGTKLGKVVVSAKVKLSGSGTIDSLTVSVSGVTLDHNLTVRKTETTGGAKAPTVYNPSSSSSSSSSSGGTKSRVITGVAPIAPITVNYGTSQANALPNTVTLNCEGGATVEAAVTWTLDNTYNAMPQTTTSYTATGPVTIPTGYTYDGTLTATVTITVWGGDQTISSIVEPTGIEVETGKLNDVDAAIAALPNRVVLKNGKGETIQVNGVVLTAPVTWKCIGGTIYSDKLSGMTAIQNFKGTLDTNDTECVNSFIGTVTLPEGYKFTSNTPAWITTTITVKKAGEATSKSISGVVIADIAQKLDYASTNKVVEVLKNKNLLPTKLILQYNGEFMAEVDIPNDTNWTARRDVSSDNQLKYTLQPTLQASNIAVPVGYNIDQAILNNAICSVYVKALDTSKLEIAIAEAEKQTENVLAYANTEPGNITDLDKIYVISDKGSNPSELDAETIKSEIPKGVRFVVDNTDMYSAFGTKLNEAKTKLRQSPDDAFNDQAACDTLAQGLTEATAALRALLANPTTGTKVNDAYVVGLVKKWLDNQSSAPWSEGEVLKPGGNRYSLRKSYTFNADPDAGIDKNIEVNLSWNFDKTYLSEDSNEGNLVLTNMTPETPQEVTFTATLTGYTIDNGNMVTVTNGTVGNYKVKVGAPVSADPGKIGEVTIPKLISGQENKNFKVQIPLRNESLKIENIAANSNITVTCTDDSLTNFTSININPPKDMQTDAPGFSFLEVYMTATAKQLSAVVASDTPAEGTDYKKTTVTLSIPSNAITLTTEAKEAGWYIPTNGLTLTADVEIYPPTVKIGTATLNTIGKTVRFKFDINYWNSYSGVWMALVPSEETTFTGDKNVGFVSDSGCGVISDGLYDIDIPITNITEGDYAVWVKVGDGNWLKSSTTYTYPTSE